MPRAARAERGQQMRLRYPRPHCDGFNWTFYIELIRNKAERAAGHSRLFKATFDLQHDADVMILYLN